MDACVGSASASAALDRWRTYRSHRDRQTRQYEISAEACNTAVIKHLSRFLDATMYLNMSTFENFTSRISTPALKGMKKRDS